MDSNGSIFISNFVVNTVIGIYDHEQHTPQPLRFDVEVGLNSDAAFTSDKLSDTVDYAAVAAFIKAELIDHRFRLLERCAGHVANAIADHFKAPWVDIRIAKLGIVPGAQEVGVSYSVER
jgi:7,8-dihydroneopterin aldolase/epimerase/oxygenase